MNDYVEVYNSFPSVEVAHERAANIDLNEMAKDVLAVTERYGLSDEIGLLLIHRHLKLNDDEVMVERQAVGDDGQIGYLTSPSAFSEELAVSSWHWANGERFPFEYVDGDLAKSVKLINESSVWAELQAVLTKHSAAEVFAVGYIERPLLDLNESSVLIERTDAEGRLQGVFPEQIDGLNPDDLLPTRWRLEETQPYAGATIYCLATYHCVVRSPGHAIEPLMHVSQEAE